MSNCYHSCRVKYRR